MESKTRLTVVNISLIVSLLTMVTFDFWLSRSGQVTFIFKAKLPQGITIKHDRLQGYKILEEGFIHILDEHTVHGEDTIVSILAYHATDSDVFVKSRTTAGKIIFLNIHVLESAHRELRYELREYKSASNEDWIDISNKQSIRIVTTLRNILVGIILILFTIRLIVWIRMAFFYRSAKTFM